MKFLLNCIFVIIFLLESLEAANISCSTSSFPTFCVVENVSIPKGDPIYYVGMDSALPGISFRGTQMTKIPTLLFGNFTQLTVATFMNTGITQLTGNDLKYSAKLDNMFIYNSTLKVLKNGVFKYSTTIQILMMMENKISKVGVNTFYGANQLKYIILSSNLLTGLPTGVFRPLKSLSSVDFSYNQLIKIQKSLFG